VSKTGQAIKNDGFFFFYNFLYAVSIDAVLMQKEGYLAALCQ
jgi:hypothetical protein